jgi:hypothetical protein
MSQKQTFIMPQVEMLYLVKHQPIFDTGFVSGSVNTWTTVKVNRLSIDSK